MDKGERGMGRGAFEKTVEGLKREMIHGITRSLYGTAPRIAENDPSLKE